MHHRDRRHGQGGLHVNVTRSEQPVEIFAVTLEPERITAAPTGPIVLARGDFPNRPLSKKSRLLFTLSADVARLSPLNNSG